MLPAFLYVRKTETGWEGRVNLPKSDQEGSWAQLPGHFCLPRCHVPLLMRKESPSLAESFQGQQAGQLCEGPNWEIIMFFILTLSPLFQLETRN